MSSGKSSIDDFSTERNTRLPRSFVFINDPHKFKSVCSKSVLNSRNYSEASAIRDKMMKSGSMCSKSALDSRNCSPVELAIREKMMKFELKPEVWSQWETSNQKDEKQNVDDYLVFVENFYMKRGKSGSRKMRGFLFNLSFRSWFS